MPDEAAIATADAWTVASMVELSVAETVMPRGALSVVLSAYALTSSGSASPYSCQPMKLRASEKPIATAGDIPVPTATPPASAFTVASMCAVFAVVMAIVPFGAEPVASRPLAEA